MSVIGQREPRGVRRRQRRREPGGRRDCHVGVAWATFQEERYGLRDEPGIKGVLEAAGAEYTGNDAANSNETQASNIEALLAAGIDVLVLNSVDPDGGPAGAPDGARRRDPGHRL